MQNIGVSGGATIISKVLGTISAVVLARLLNPIDFSIIGISMVLLGFVNQFSDAGFYAAVVQRKDKIKEAQYTGFYLRLVLSFLVALMLFFLAPLWAKFYDAKVITNVVRISLISILIAPFSFIPATHFLRELQFKKSAIIGISRNITYALVTVILAFLGFRYWSIIWGTVIGSLVNVLIACIIYPWKFKFIFNPRIAKDLFNFGKFILLSGLVLFAISNIDNMLIGKVSGMVLLGYYVIAYKWGLWVSDNLATIIGSVMFPTFSKIQDDLERLKKGYLQSLKYFSIIIFPASLGLLVIAPEFIKVVLSPKWIPATIPMQILCIVGLFQSLSTLDRNFFVSKGKPEINTKLDTLFLIILVILLYPLVRLLGISGAGIAVLISALTVKIFQYLTIRRLINLKLRNILQMIFTPFFCSMIMVTIIVLARNYLYIFRIQEWLTFSILLCLGIIVYLVLLIIISKNDLFELWHKLKEQK